MPKNEKKRSPSKAALEEKKPKRMNPVAIYSIHPPPPIPINAAAPPLLGNVDQAPFANVGNVNMRGVPHLLPFENINRGALPCGDIGQSNNFALAPFGGGAAISYPPQYGNQSNVAALPPIVDSDAEGAGYIPIANSNGGNFVYPPIGGGIAISYPPQYGNSNAAAPPPLRPIDDSNGGIARSYPPIGNNNALYLDYCDHNGSDLKNCPDDRKFDDDDDDDDDDNVMGDNAYARANYDRYRKKVRCKATGINKFKNFLLTYHDGGNRSPIICYLGWKEDEAVGEYPYPVFWLEYEDGDKIGKKVSTFFRTELLAGISQMQVNQSDPRFEARDHLIMYYVHRVDNPPQFDQRKALKKYVKEEMENGDFVALTLNQSDDSVISVEDHEVTNNRKKPSVNGNTYKVFHLKAFHGNLSQLLESLGAYSGFKLKSAGKDRGTVYFIYQKSPR